MYLFHVIQSHHNRPSQNVTSHLQLNVFLFPNDHPTSKYQNNATGKKPLKHTGALRTAKILVSLRNVKIF